MQSDIFKHVIETVKKSLTEASGKLYKIVDGFTTDKSNQIKIAVTDIFQIANDKTGQRIIVDEVRYEVPTQFVMNLRILFSGKTLEDTLSILGYVAAYLKDNNNFECGEYNWHGNDINRFFLEPVIRRESVINGENLYLDYKIELQLNSTKVENFVRVEKKDLRSNQIK